MDSVSSKYALSFTSGGLLAREAGVVAEEYLRVRDWAGARRTVIDDNLLQTRTLSSSIRVSRETIQRLSVFTWVELELLVEAGPTERRHLMWAAACRRYDLIGHFAEEVLRERYLVMTPTLSLQDFDRFLAGKAWWHPELDELTSSTRSKLRQNLFRMLHEAGLRIESGDIVTAVLSERVHQALSAHAPSEVRFFPTTLPAEVSR